MNVRKFIPGFVMRGEKVGRLKVEINEARGYLTDLMVEECELRGHIFEVLEVVFERVGGLERKADLLRAKADFLRRKLCERKSNAKENQEFWKRQEEEIYHQYQEAFERAEVRKQERENQGSENKKARLKKVWMKLVKAFHPDKHMNKSEERTVYEGVIKTVNQAKKDGDLEKLEAIAENPQKFLNETRGQYSQCSSREQGMPKNSRYKKWFYDEEKELLETLKSLKLEIAMVRKEIKEMKKCQEMILWAMWKGRPKDFGNAIREMERELSDQIKTLEMTILKMEEKMAETIMKRCAA